jgi:hypothetical protein
MSFNKRFLAALATLCLPLLFISCGGGSGGGSSTGGSGSTGTLSLSLQDASMESYRAVYVTIDRVEVHLGGDESQDARWRNVLAPDKVGKTYNLLELVNGVREELGIVDLDEGPYTQMRLIIGRTPDSGINVLSRSHPFANYVIAEPDLETHELKVPSGFQTGIKIVQGFDISANQTTELILDFDVSKSVVKAGNSGNWLLKPTIKVFELVEYAIVRGAVTENDEKTAVPGALVSAQQIDADGNPVVYAATVTDENGTYALFLNPDRNNDQNDDLYSIVAYKKQYDAGCAEVITSAGMNQAPLSTRVALAGPKQTGTLAGTVTIAGGDAEKYVTLSFRQSANCRSADDPATNNPAYIEVKSENYAHGATYSTTLTVGEYDVNASTFDETSGLQFTDEVLAVFIKEGAPQAWNVALPPVQ